MIIAIDFDGTIVDHIFPDIGDIKPNAKEVINRLFDEDHYIIIWTCRYEPNDVRAMMEYLAVQGIKYHALNQNCPNLDFSPRPKIYADVYIDDRNLGGIPENWEVIYQIINKTKT